MANEELQFNSEEGVGVVTLNRPQARNALTIAMYEQLAQICKDIIEQKIDVQVLILTGAGDKAFAAGTDINSFKDLHTAEDALAYERLMDTVLGTLESVPIPTVAAIRGACTGGGAAIAACCDLRIADEHLKYGFPIARTLGNCLSAGNLARLVELLGSALTREILFTARLILKDEALNVQLINECHEDPLLRARELGDTLKQHSPLTLAASKEGLRRLRVHASAVQDDDLIVRCYTSEDFREGMDAFLSKRRPQWKGR